PKERLKEEDSKEREHWKLLALAKELPNCDLAASVQPPTGELWFAYRRFPRICNRNTPKKHP
ncbi:MAG: hypothetical protein P8Y36_13720, partial [Alphaproteobacteria bacterium]